METIADQRTHIGLGYTNLTDAFQAGREAAQMAKNDLHHGSPDLVIAIGPSDINFKDFIEGVRLVTGEDKLIGIPTQHLFTSQLLTPDIGAVLMVQTKTCQFAVASSAFKNTEALSGITSLISGFRSARGNIRHQFEYHGILAFDNSTDGFRHRTDLLASEAGLDSWIVSAQPKVKTDSPFICHDSVIPNGIVAIECLSHVPWGLGAVDVSSFAHDPKIYREGIRSALRDALSQLKGEDAACGFLLFDFPLTTSMAMDIKNLFGTDELRNNNIPLIGISIQNQIVRPLFRPLIAPQKMITAVVMPK